MITVYTCLTDGYCHLNTDQDYLPEFDYVCFTDDKNIELPHPWKKVYIDVDISDPVTKSRLFKIKSHEYFEDDSIIVHSDPDFKILNDVVLSHIDLIKNGTYDYISRLHPYRKTYCDEMIWLFYNGLSSKENIVKQTEKLINEGYNFQNHVCTLNGYLVKKINQYTKEFDEQWWKEYIGFDSDSKRDQLPHGIALQKKSNERHGFFEGDPWDYSKTTPWIKTTANKNWRPNLEEVSEVQSYLTGITKTALIAPLVMSKPLSV